VTPVTNETDEGLLERMHIKIGNNYPVYLITAEKGDKEKTTELQATL
jgi:hypothetical protein